MLYFWSKLSPNKQMLVLFYLTNYRIGIIVKIARQTNLGIVIV